MIPAKATVVIAVLKSISGNTCIYVTLPEYDNCEGVIYGTELAKRLKQNKKQIKELERSNFIVCIVTSVAKFKPESKSEPELIELSLKGVDEKHHPSIVTRFTHLEKILKVYKYINEEYNIPISNESINSLTMFDLDEIDTLEKVYQDMLKNVDKLVDSVDLTNDELKTTIKNDLKNMIKQTNPSIIVPLTLIVWSRDKNNRDPVYILRDVFTDIKQKFKFDIRYVGAPHYQLFVKSIAEEDIENLYTDINKSITEILESLEVTGFKMELEKPLIQPGEVSIVYPRHILL